MLDFCKAKRYVDQDVHTVQHKLDGWHIMCYPDKIFTRKPLDVTDKLKFMHITRRIPKGTIVVGELYCPNEEATSVPTLVNEKSNKLIFQPFAVPIYDFKDMTWKSVETGNQLIKQLGWDCLWNFTFNITGKMSNEECAKYWREEAVKNEIEGYIAKNYNYAEWYKIKPFHYADCKVISTKTSTSATLYGDLKAIVVAVPRNGKWETVASVGSGFTAEFRNNIDKKTLIGRIAEIQYDGLAANGQLKFPRFIRWREDKSECTPWKELMHDD